MDSTIARVGSAALVDLQNDLTLLSKSLLRIHELMDADMRAVNAAWQDGKYQEFVQGYKPQIDKCETIANRYAVWCSKVLDPTIQNAVAAENVNVSGGDAVGAVVGGTAAAAAVGGAGIAGGFNLGSQRIPKSETQANSQQMQTDSAGSLSKAGTTEARKASGDKKTTLIDRVSGLFGGKKESLSEADKACQDAYGEDWHDYKGVPDESVKTRPVSFKKNVSKESGKFEIGGSESLGGEVTVPVKGIPIGAKAGVQFQGKYTSGGKTTDSSIEGVANCVIDNLDNNN